MTNAKNTTAKAILLVDDDPDDLFALRAALEPLGLELVVAGGGEDALKHVLQRDFALIVMDLLMPRMNGFEVAALIRDRERTRRLPIIILTGYDPDGMRELPGFFEDGLLFLQKPVHPSELRGTVLERSAAAQ